MQYQNKKKVVDILKKIKTEEKLNSFISALSQIHEDLNKPGGQSNFKKIITDVAGQEQATFFEFLVSAGFAAFIKAEFNEIASTLRTDWSQYAVPAQINIPKLPDSITPDTGKDSDKTSEEFIAKVKLDKQKELEDEKAARLKAKEDGYVHKRFTVPNSFKSLNHKIFEGLTLFSDADLDSEIIIEKDFDQLYDRFLGTIKQIKQEVTGLFVQNKLYKPGEDTDEDNVGFAGNAKKDLNLLMYAIKDVEQNIHDKLNELLVTFANTPQYANILNAKNSFERASILKGHILARDMAVIEPLFTAAIMLVSPKLASVIFLGNMAYFKKRYEKLIENDEAKADLIPEVANKIFLKVFINRLLTFCAFGYNYNIRSFTSGVSLSNGIYADVVDSVFGKSKTKDVVKCPVCFKNIKWSIPRDERAVGSYQYSVPVFSLFIKEDGSSISTFDLNFRIDNQSKRKEVRRFAPPPQDIFAHKHDKEFASSLNNALTWEEINSLIYSGDAQKQREGFARRSGALYSLFIEFNPKGSVSKALVSKTLLVSSMMFRCPGEAYNNSGCGFNAKQTESMKIQPSWGGVIGDEVPKQTFDGVSEQNKAKLSNMSKEGFKFSRTVFNCPCHIKQYDADTRKKFKTMALRMSGPYAMVDGAQSSLPTNPDGLYSDIAPGTASYIICGATTSLSSYDRSKVVDYLREVKNMGDIDMVGVSQGIASKKDSVPKISAYKYLLEQLLQMGLDIEDLIYINEEVSSEQINKESSRIDKLMSFVKNAIIGLQEGSEIERLLSGFPLTCPFGHKFTVTQSLQFAKTHAGLKMTEDKNKSAFTNLLLTNGLNNYISLIQNGSLIKAEKVGEDIVPRQNRFYYNEWVTRPIEERAVKFKRVEGANNDKAILILRFPKTNGELEDYFVDTLSIRDNVWESQGSSKPDIEETEYLGREFSEIAIEKSVSGGDGQKTTFHGDEKSLEDYAESQYNDSESDYYEQAIPSLSGDSLEDKMDSLSRAIKSILTIIITWTEKINYNNVFTEITAPFDSSKIKQVGSEIFDSIIPDIENIYDEDGGLIDDESQKAKAIGKLKSVFSNIFERKVKNLGVWILNNAEQSKGQYGESKYGMVIAKEVVSSSLLDEEMMDLYTLKITEQQLGEKLEQSLRAKPEHLKYITYQSSEYSVYSKAQHYAISQIFLVSYSQYLTASLVALSRDYFSNKKSVNYIGYNIGLDLSSFNAILGRYDNGIWSGGLTFSDLEAVVDGSEKDDIDFYLANSALPIEQRIDACWVEIRKTLERAKYVAASPTSMRNAREFILEKLKLLDNKNVDPSELSVRRRELSRFTDSFPIKSFVYTNDDKDFGAKKSYEYIPYLARNNESGKELFLSDLGGTESTTIITVSDKLKDLSPDGYKQLKQQVFESEEEAAEYISQNTTKEGVEKIINDYINFLLKERSSGRMNKLQFSIEEKKLTNLRRDPQNERLSVMRSYVYKNDKYNFDASKYQVGTYGEKSSQALTWPPPEEGYSSKVSAGHVCLILPYPQSAKGGATFNAGNIRNINITDHRVVVDVRGYPTDISPLFVRGKEAEDREEIQRLTSEIEDLASKRNDEIARLFRVGGQNVEVKTNDVRGYYNDLIRAKQEKISNIPLKVKSQSVYGGAGASKEVLIKKTQPAIILEDPITAYRIVKNSDLRGLKINEAEKERLIKFIYDVYNLDTIKAYAIILLEENIKQLKLEPRTDEHQKELQLKINKLNDDPEYIFEIDGLPELKVGKRFLNMETLMNDSIFRSEPGQYFDVVESDDKMSFGTFIQYIYSGVPNAVSLESSDKGPMRHPSIPEMCAASVDLANLGFSAVTGPGSRSLQRAQEQMTEYVIRKTKGEESLAEDSYIQAGEYSQNIKNRLRKLAGIISIDDVPMPFENI